MADQKKPRDRTADVERLAVQIYVPLVATAQQRGKTHEAVANDAITAAEAFFAVLDKRNQPQG